MRVSDDHPSPRVIAWESTRACRFACVHCRANAQTEPDPHQLTTEETFRLIDDIAGFAKPVFILSGGDPLLRKDIFDIAARADERGFRVVMAPSGSKIVPGTVRRMKESGVRMVSISLDGSNPEMHDGFRKVTGSFEMAASALKVFKDGGMPFQINTTVTQHNLGDLPNIRDLAERLGAKAWDVFMLVPTGRAKVRMEISPEEYERTLRRVYGWNRSLPLPIKMTCAPHYTRVIAQMEGEDDGKPPDGPAGRPHGGGRGSRSGGRGCMAGNGFCFISSTGEVYGCGFLPVKAGDVRQESFQRIYQGSPLFRSLRDHDLLEGRCGVCEYRSVCGGCRARALGTSGNLLGEEPYCVYHPSGEGHR